MPIRFLILILFFLFPSICHSDITTGLVGWWKFNETSGNAVDSSSSGFTGTPVGTVAGKNCQSNYCRSFNGTSDYINIGAAHFNFTKLTPFSGTAWIKTSSSSAQTVISNWQVTVNPGYQFGMTDITAHKLNFALLAANGGAARLDREGSTTVDNGLWNHIAFTYDGSATAAGIKLYVNGVEETESTSSNNDPGTLVDVETDIGRRNRTTSAEYFNGLIDDVRLYNRALTASDIAQLYNQGFYGNKTTNALINNAVLN